MRPKHFSCKCTTKRNPIFVNWSCNARSGGDDHRQCFFVQGFRPSPLSHNSHNYFVQDEGRCLSYISLSWGLSFFHDFIIFSGNKGCSLFEIVSSLFLYFEWRHRWRQDLTDLVHPITQGNSLRASSPRGTEVGRGGGGEKGTSAQRPRDLVSEVSRLKSCSFATMLLPSNVLFTKITHGTKHLSTT